MADSKRRERPRFTKGQFVEITSVIVTRFTGTIGVIMAVIPHSHGRTADKYTVQFTTGKECMFWDIQLKGSSGRIESHYELVSMTEPRQEPGHAHPEAFTR